MSVKQKPFIDIDFFNRQKTGMNCSGDVFISRRSPDNSTVYAVLADGLGSGLQAHVAASLTATMALEYIMADIDIRRAATMIMDALPLCPERHISYSTFTMVRAKDNGDVRLIEYGNPHSLHFSGFFGRKIPGEVYTLPRWGRRKMLCANFRARLNDRIVVCSDGVTQAGLGSMKYPFGWGTESLLKFLMDYLEENPEADAGSLAQLSVNHALNFDFGVPGDDTTCAIIHYRKTRELQVLTGPPFSKASDKPYAELVLQPDVTTIISGGTTAELVGRELNRPLTMSLASMDPDVPATSEMEGAALVCEGCITLSFCEQLLNGTKKFYRQNGATRMRDLLLHHDRITFNVGTGINPAHHDPKMPVELEMRRTLIHRIAKILEDKYCKEVSIRYF